MVSGRVSKAYVINNKLGLHARAAATLVRIANQFECEITIRKQRHVVDGKSILGIMTLAASRGTPIEITGDGPDAGEAIRAIGACIDNRFGEDE